MRFLLGLWAGTKIAGETIKGGGIWSTIIFIVVGVFAVEHYLIITKVVLWIGLFVVLYYNRFLVRQLFSKLATILNKNSSTEDPR